MNDTSARLRQTFLDLITIPSPSRNERAVADFLCSRLSQLGYTAHEDEAGSTFGGNCGNLIVTVDATVDAPSLFIAAHIDTVEIGDKPITPVQDAEDSDILRSDGSTILAADDKAGVAAILEFLQQLNEAPIPHGKLIIVFSVGEEIELQGARALSKGLLQGCEMGLVFDHGNPDEVVIGAPTKLALDITIHGIGGHGAFPAKRVNAAKALAKGLANVNLGQLDSCSTANLGLMKAGTAINVIPDIATAEIEIRSHCPKRLNQHLNETLEAIREGAEQTQTVCINDDGSETILKASAETHATTCYEAFRCQEDDPVVLRACAAIRARGGEPKTVIAQGGFDASIWNQTIPVVVTGSGMHGAHSLNEYADMREMMQGVETLKQWVNANLPVTCGLGC